MADKTKAPQVAAAGLGRTDLTCGAISPSDKAASRPRQRGGRRSRDKGARTERAIVKVLQGAAFASERVPLSGASGGRFAGDVSMPLLGRDLRLEVKARADGFRDWIENADALVLKADRREALVVVRLKFAVEIAQHAERGRR